METDPEYNDILVVYDAAAFAYQKEALDAWIDEKRLSVQMPDWYSFEHYTLTQAPFLTILTQEEIEKDWEILKQTAITIAIENFSFLSNPFLMRIIVCK